MASDRNPDEFDLAHAKELIESGAVNADLMFKISMTCEQFFWVGRHARGAVEDAEKLEGLAG